jgi:hypothetical protein
MASNDIGTYTPSCARAVFSTPVRVFQLNDVGGLSVRFSGSQIKQHDAIGTAGPVSTNGRASSREVSDDGAMMPMVCQATSGFDPAAA